MVKYNDIRDDFRFDITLKTVSVYDNLLHVLIFSGNAFDAPCLPDSYVYCSCNYVKGTHCNINVHDLEDEEDL